jgi:hypothetical protein
LGIHKNNIKSDEILCKQTPAKQNQSMP